MALDGAKKKLAAARGKPKQADEKAAPPNSRLAVQRSFAKATRELAKMLRGDEAIYRIPWIALVGEPGSDKERLLPGSGLTARAGSPSTFGLEGDSANVWWFFDNAVVVDFAAEYFDANMAPAATAKKGLLKRLFRRAGAGQAGWNTVLEALRKNRPRRPLDGMVVTIPVEDLLVRTPEQTTALTRRAEALAERVHAARYQLGVHFPVYVVLTGCEGLTGFESFARSVPDPVRDQMCGWSSPHAPDADYQPEWIDQAIASLHEATCVSQLDLLAGLGDQTERDALYLLPRAIQNLRDPLRAYLDPIFRSTTYRKAPPLRGIYLTGTVDLTPEIVDEVPAGPGAKAPVPAPAPLDMPPCFVRQVFTEKVFPEAGVAIVDEEQNRALSKRVRGFRLAAAAAVLLGGTGLFVQQWSTRGRVTEFRPALELMRSYRSLARTGTIGTAEEVREKPRDVIQALIALSGNEFRTLTAPTTLFDGLDEQTNRALAYVTTDWAARPLRERLVEKADRILANRGPSAAPSASLAKTAMAAAQQASAGTAAAALFGGGALEGDIGELRGAADEIETLYASFLNYSQFRPDQVAALFQYLYGVDFSEAFDDSDAPLYKRAKESRNRAGDLVFDASYRNRARERLSALAQRFQTKHFRDHPLRSELPRLAQLVDTIGELKVDESPYRRLMEIHDAIVALEKRIEGGQADWLLADAFDPGSSYKDLVEVLNRPAFAGEGSAAPFGAEFDQHNQRLFVELTAAIWNQTSKLSAHSSEGFKLLARPDGRVVLSEELVAIRDALKDLRRQPYIIEDQRAFMLGLAEKAGERREWNADILGKVLELNEKFQVYVKGDRRLHPALHGALMKASRMEYRALVGGMLAYARPEMKALEETQVAQTYTAESMAALKRRIGNLASQHDTILKIRDVLDQVHRDLSLPEDNALFNALRDDAEQLMDQVDAILAQRKLYEVRDDEFSWWKSEQPAGVVAFGARDQSDMLDRLDKHRQAITELANDFAGPLVTVKTKLGEPFASHPDVERWKEILRVLADYERKVPGNDLEALERFIAEDLNKLELSTCSEQLKRTLERTGASNDFFDRRQYQVARRMNERCAEILQQVTLEGYVAVQTFFNENLAGRFPFAEAEAPAESENRDVAEFFKRFDEYSAEFKALARPRGQGGSEPFGPNSDEVLRFIQQVDGVRPLFAAMLTTEGDNPDLTLNANFEFRVNRENEVNANQVIDWWATIGDQQLSHRDNKRGEDWRTNDPVQICLRWAKDADFLPAAQQRADHARVNGRTVCYAFGGRWAMLRLLKVHASTPADRGRQPFLRPHTLRFETETSLAKTRTVATGLLTDQRVYVRVSIVLPGEKSSYEVPDFPRRAPELKSSFLKKNGIVAESGKRKGW